MIKFESNSHWYGRDGRPQHDADLRVARKEFLYPSVTTIDKDVFKNDFLDRWKLNELVNAATETFRQPHEGPEDYANRIYELSLEKAKTAANFGKEIHDAIEHYPQLPLDQNLHPWVEKFRGWYDANVESGVSREKVLVDHEIGVAGRCDFIGLGRGPFVGQRILVDFKTQNVKRDKTGKKKPAFYDSWGRQLGFYAVSFAKEAKTFPESIPTTISLIFDSNEPETPFERVWTKEEILAAYQTFVVGAWLWFEKRNYWPQAGGKWSLTPSITMPL